jgi:hypothetical protein
MDVQLLLCILAIVLNLLFAGGFIYSGFRDIQCDCLVGGIFKYFVAFCYFAIVVFTLVSPDFGIAKVAGFNVYDRTPVTVPVKIEKGENQKDLRTYEVSFDLVEERQRNPLTKRWNKKSKSTFSAQNVEVRECDQNTLILESFEIPGFRIDKELFTNFLSGE